MKTKTSITTAAIILSFLLSGCSRYYYAPDMANVPLLQKKNETRVNVATSAGTELTAFELQGAHAFTDHLGGMFNFASGGSSYDIDGLTHDTYAEAGVGYFYPFAKHVVAEGYGGIGVGGVKNDYGSASDPSKVVYLKPWIQPSIGVRFSFFELALSARIASLNYVSVKSPTLLTDYQNDLDIVKNNRTTFLFEPALTMRVGYKYVLLQVQILESANTIPTFPQEVINENIGLIFTIPPPKTNSFKNHSL